MLKDARMLDSMKEMYMLSTELNIDQAWKKVAGYFRLDTIKLGSSPSAYDVLHHLKAKKIPLEDLYNSLVALKLDNAASRIRLPEIVQIVKQPYCALPEGCFWDQDGVLRVKAGVTLHLKIEAKGSPNPKFQWLCGNIPVCSEKDYIIPDFSEVEAVYCCKVWQEEMGVHKNEVQSEDVNVKLIDELQDDPHILTFDSSAAELECGEQLTLSVTVSPTVLQPTFTWWHNAKHLKGFESNVLQITQVDEKHGGTYECRVKNQCGEDSQKKEIKVKPRRPNPSQKKALLISIEKYDNQDLRLNTPHNDAKVLKDCLDKYGFECTMREDLPAKSIKEEVGKFFATLQKDAFVLFFFGGHGFMEKRSLYMMGSDAESQCKIEQVVSEDFVINSVQQYKPLMFISILDMCQTPTKRDNFPITESKQWDCTLFRCYSTSQNRLALEEQGCENSVYLKHLREALLKERDSTFNNLINQVSQSVANDPKTQIKGQRPEVRQVVIHDFKLSDPLRSSR